MQWFLDADSFTFLPWCFFGSNNPGGPTLIQDLLSFLQKQHPITKTIFFPPDRLVLFSFKWRKNNIVLWSWYNQLKEEKMQTQFSHIVWKSVWANESENKKMTKPKPSHRRNHERKNSKNKIMKIANHKIKNHKSGQGSFRRNIERITAK